MVSNELLWSKSGITGFPVLKRESNFPDAMRNKENPMNL